jgi:hypothetical protein
MVPMAPWCLERRRILLYFWSSDNIPNLPASGIEFEPIRSYRAGAKFRKRELVIQPSTQCCCTIVGLRIEVELTVVVLAVAVVVP